MEYATDPADAPEFYVTHVGFIEDAGGGNARMPCCIKRRGLLLPRAVLIWPIEQLVIVTGICDAAIPNIVRRNALMFGPSH